MSWIGKTRMKRIGIFGGTFDPVHVGHMILAAECRDQLGLDRLLWVLTPNPPHKLGQSISPWETRYELLQAALADDSGFELSRVDIDRPEPHYTLDTVYLLKEQFPGAELFYLIGGDSLHDLPNWHRPQELLAEVTGFGVMHRPGDKIDMSELEKSLPGVTQKISFVDAPLLEISSRELRQRIAHRQAYRYYLPQAVYEIVQAKCLYRECEE
jgi:nicotinate-nucleotide adenylyltransferase